MQIFNLIAVIRFAAAILNYTITSNWCNRARAVVPHLSHLRKYWEFGSIKILFVKMRKSSKISLKTSAIYIGLVFYICLFVLMKMFAIRTVNKTRSVPDYATSLDFIVIEVRMVAGQSTLSSLTHEMTLSNETWEREELSDNIGSSMRRHCILWIHS